LESDYKNSIENFKTIAKDDKDLFEIFE
jgi:hypothetical protein